MRNVLYYHAYLTDDYGAWANIFMEQMKQLEDSGLKDNLDNAVVSCITKDDLRWLSFRSMFNHYFPNCTIYGFMDNNPDDNHMLQNLNTDKSMTENLLLHNMWKDSFDGDFNILYLHTKGVTAQKKHLEVGDVDTYIKYYYWRNYMQWGTIEKWRECVEALKSYDTAGASYKTEPSPHYMGNFWWSKSQHIRTLPNPVNKDWFEDIKRNSKNEWMKTAPNRFRDEMWVCSSPNTLSFNIYDEPISPLHKPIKRETYGINL